MAKLVLSVVVLSFATGAFAQDPYVVAPEAYQKQFENAWVRVTRVHYAPNETIAEHEHPSRPTIYIYLKDGGPVLFKHEHGESGDYAATRAATKAGAYRMAAGRTETHVVQNRSDLPSDFLQVEIKTSLDATTFSGRRSRDPVEPAQNSRKVEFDGTQLRITRIVCTASGGCTTLEASAPNPALIVALATGDTTWVSPAHRVENANPTAGEYLVIEFKKVP